MNPPNNLWCVFLPSAITYYKIYGQLFTRFKNFVNKGVSVQANPHLEQTTDTANTPFVEKQWIVTGEGITGYC